MTGFPWRRVCNAGQWLLCLCLLSLPASAADESGIKESSSFTVRNARSLLVEGVYRVSAQVHYQLGSQAREALRHGVPLVLGVEIQVLQPRPWLWDKTVAELYQRYQLRYHALSRRYLVTNFHTGVQRSYYNLGDALHAVGTLYDLPVLDQRLLTQDVPHEVRLRADLEVEALPTPVRLWAYISSDWGVQSEWYSWPLQP